jgi:hypothetical protein
VQHDSQHRSGGGEVTADLAAEIAECLQDTQSPWGSSRFNLWHRCRKAHDLRHAQGLVSLGDRPKYFGIGSLTHAGINFLQRGVIAGEATPRNWELVIEAAAAKLPGEICDEAWRLLSAYFAHWGVECAGWPEGSKILGAELFLQDGLADPNGCAVCGGSGGGCDPATACGACNGSGADLLTGGAFALPYTARADTVLELPSGEIVIPDTKTRRSAFPEERQQYAQGLATRPQFTGLAWLVRRHLKLDEPPHIWVNAIVKTKIPKFDRLLVRMTPEAVAAWEKDHRAVAAAMARGDEPIPNRSECAPDMGSRCEYFDWCHGNDELRARKFTKRDAA